MGDVRLLSYNVRSLRDDGPAVAAVIRAARPDVVCIQEAPRLLRWRSRCAWLARESGLVLVTGGRPAGAMLLLARMGARVVSSRDVLLSKRPGLHQRGLATAVLEVAGVRLGVASMHLDLDAAERLRHAAEVLDRLDQLTAPVVLAGDVNEEPGEPAWAALGVRLQDAYATAPRGPGATYSARAPQRRIDGVFVDRRLEVVSCEVIRTAGVERASDHLPVLAVVRSSGPPP
ncbi:MAG: endonuclease/exonuclease/phosphatase family protein [Actinomycetota bacterium]|nr:endonuclease/exonuclease/phosphatase family protein [Actinomycetota bacterium]